MMLASKTEAASKRVLNFHCRKAHFFCQREKAKRKLFHKLCIRNNHIITIIIIVIDSCGFEDIRVFNISAQALLY